MISVAFIFSFWKVAVAAVGGFLAKHGLTKAKLASLEAKLKSYEQIVVLDGKQVIAAVRAHLGL
jgi:hypothetical protein